MSSKSSKQIKGLKGGRYVKDMRSDGCVSKETHNNQRTKYGGMETSIIKRIKELEYGSRLLKKMYALRASIIRSSRISLNKALEPAERHSAKGFGKVLRN